MLEIRAQRLQAAGNLDEAAHTLRTAIQYCPRFLPAVTAYAQLSTQIHAHDDDQLLLA